MVKLICVKSDPNGKITPGKVYSSIEDKPHKAPNGEMVYTLVEVDDGCLDYIIEYKCVVPLVLLS